MPTEIHIQKNQLAYALNAYVENINLSMHYVVKYYFNQRNFNFLNKFYQK